MKLLLILVLLGLSGCLPDLSRSLPSSSSTERQSESPILTSELLLKLPDRARQKVQIGEHTLEVEVVHSPSSISQGLSGRSAIGADGMLFVFEQLNLVSFWMKEMKFNLDLIWIAENQVVGVTSNVPHPALGTPLDELPTYLPPVPVDMVLEVEAGQAEKWGIETGNSIELLTPINPSGGG